jgi:hypothetical protein
MRRNTNQGAIQLKQGAALLKYYVCRLAVYGMSGFDSRLGTLMEIPLLISSTEDIAVGFSSIKIQTKK